MICYIVRYFLLEYRGSLRVFSGVPVADLYNFTEFGTALTTILPILFQYCYKYCYSDSRNLWAVMKAGGLAL